MKHSLSCAYLHTITMGSNEIKRLLSGYRQCCGGNMISNNSCVKLFRITVQICEQTAIKKTSPSVIPEAWRLHWPYETHICNLYFSEYLTRHLCESAFLFAVCAYLVTALHSPSF